MENKISKIKDVLSEMIDKFSKWISSLSWLKFIFFIFLLSMVSDFIQREIFSYREDENWIHSLTGIFIFISFGMKILMNKTVKAQIREKEAVLLAEKEILQRELSDSKLQLMQAQIEPHFLFNTLSSLSYLITTDAEKANKMLLNLTTYLRYALPKIRENTPTNKLRVELENINAYLDIMKVRVGDRLNAEIIVMDGLKDYEFPSMVLQPIVENAIKYGIEETVDGGQIKIEGAIIDGRLSISITNTGNGLNINKEKQGNGLALKNIQNRLELLYGKNWSFIMESPKENQVLVKIIIPLSH